MKSVELLELLRVLVAPGGIIVSEQYEQPLEGSNDQIDVISSE